MVKKEDHTVISYRYLEMDNTFCIPFIDDASIENSLNCLAACLYLMMPADQITERMVRLEPVAMRLEVKEGKHSACERAGARRSRGVYGRCVPHGRKAVPRELLRGRF